MKARLAGRAAGLATTPLFTFRRPQLRPNRPEHAGGLQRWNYAIFRAMQLDPEKDNFFCGHRGQSSGAGRQQKKKQKRNNKNKKTTHEAGSALPLKAFR